MKPPAGQSLSVGLRCFAAVVFIAVFPAVPLPAADATTKQIQFFESKIRPLLAENCYTCHSLNANPRFANLRLDSRAGMLTGRGPWARHRSGQSERQSIDPGSPPRKS